MQTAPSTTTLLWLLTMLVSNCRAIGFSAPDFEPRAPMVPQWQHALQDNPLLAYRPREFAIPVIDAENGTVIAGSSGGRLHCFKRDDGRLLWHFDTDGPIEGSVRLAGPALFFGGGDGRVYALERKTGKPFWREPYDTGAKVNSRPAVAGGRVFVTTDKNELIALDAADGLSAWPQTYRREHQREFTHNGTGSPTVAEGLVLTGFSDGTFVALEQDRPEVRWSADLSEPTVQLTDVDSTPVVVGDRVYVTALGAGLVALNVKDGRIIWKQPIDDPSSPVIWDGQVIVSTGETREVRGYDAATGALRWKSRFEYGVLSEPVVAFDRVYVATTWALAMLDRKTGEILAKLPVFDGFSARPTAFGGQIFALSNRGVLHAIRAE